MSSALTKLWLGMCCGRCAATATWTPHSAGVDFRKHTPSREDFTAGAQTARERKENAREGETR